MRDGLEGEGRGGEGGGGVRSVMVWYGMVWYGMVWVGSAQGDIDTVNRRTSRPVCRDKTRRRCPHTDTQAQGTERTSNSSAHAQRPRRYERCSNTCSAAGAACLTHSVSMLLHTASRDLCRRINPCHSQRHVRTAPHHTRVRRLQTMHHATAPDPRTVAFKVDCRNWDTAPLTPPEHSKAWNSSCRWLGAGGVKHGQQGTQLGQQGKTRQRKRRNNRQTWAVVVRW